MLQVYKRMFQGMFTANLGWGAAGWELGSLTDVAEAQMEQHVKANANVIAQHLQNIGSENLSINNLNASDLRNIQKLLRTLDMSSVDLTQQGVPVTDIVSKMNEFAGASAVVQNTSRVERAKPEVRGQNPEYKGRTSDFNTTKEYVVEWTNEKVSTVEVATIFGSKNEQMNNAELASEVNIWSLRQLISGLDASMINSIVNEIIPQLEPNKDGEILFEGVIGLRNHNAGVINKVFKDLKYNPNWDLGGIEALYLYRFLLDTNNSQKEVISLSKQDKIDRLLDFNKNGQLDGDTDFYVWEGQMKSNLTLLSHLNDSGDFDTLLRAIQIDPVKFEQDMNNNFFTAREMFKRHLGTAIEAWFQPQVLVQGKTAEYTKAQFELQDAYISDIENEILKDPRIRSAMNAMGESRWFKQAIRDAAEDMLSMELLAGAGAVLTPDGLGLGWSLAITDKYNLSLGLNGDTPFIWVTRKIIEGERLNVSAGAWVAIKDGTMKVTPVVAASYLVRKGYSESDIKRLFPDTLPERGYRVNGYATASFAGLNGWVVIDKNKAPVIADMVKKVGKDIDSLFTQTYTPTTEADRVMGNMILGRYNDAFKLLKVDAHKEQLKASIKQGYLTYLENNLYADNSGLDITGVGISYLAGHFPIITAQFEDLSQTYEGVDNSGTASEVLATGLDSKLAQIGAKEVMYNGNKVYRLDWVQKGNVSADAASGAQVEFDADGLGAYVSGNISTLVGGTYVLPNGDEAKVLILGDGAWNGTELVSGGYTDRITSSIPTVTRTKTITNYDKPIYETIDTTSTSIKPVGSPEVRFYHLDNFRSVVDTKIKSWSIIDTEKNATPLAKFQKDVVDAGRDIDSAELNTLWNSLSSGELNTFLTSNIGSEFNQALTSAVSEDEKLFVIESIMMAMRNDLSTMWDGFGDNVSEIAWWKSLREYYENSTMKDRMVENLESSTAFSYSSIDSAYTSLMTMKIDGVALGDMNKFTTQMSYADVVSSSAASQVIKEKIINEEGKIVEVDAWIRDTSISFSSGVHETIGVSAPVGMTDAERKNAIANLPNRFIQRKVNEVNSLTGGNYRPEDIRYALTHSTSLGGVELKYYASLTFTGNCLNLQIDEGVTLTQTVSSGSKSKEIVGYETNTVTYEENAVQVKEAVFNGTRHATNNAKVFALGGWGWDTSKKDVVGSQPNDPTDPVDTPNETPGDF